MKFIFIIYSILILNYAIADKCQGLFENRNSTVSLSDEKSKYQPAFLYSLGRKLKKNKEETNEFLSGSFLYLGEDHTPYTAKTCIDSTLTVSNPTDDLVLQFKIDNSEPTAIIQDPINELPELKSTCNILSFPGDYTLTIKDSYSGVSYIAEFIVHSTSRKVFFYDKYKSNITYNDAYLQVDDKKIAISTCTDYFSNSILYYSNSRKSKIITTIIKHAPPSDILLNWCTLMSVTGLYQLIDHGQVIGEFKTNSESNYESYNDLNELKYNIELTRSGIKPIYTDIHNNQVAIISCSTNKRNNYLFTDNYINNIINFDSVKVLYQDTRHLKLYPMLINQQINEKYKLDERINQIEINGLLNDLKVPEDEMKNPQKCRNLIYPGTYKVSLEKNPAMIMKGHDFFEINTRHNHINNNFETHYKVFINDLNDKNEQQPYECVDIFNANGYSNSYISKLIRETDYTNIERTGKLKREGPVLFVTSVEHDDIPLSWEDIKLVENEDWLDDNNSKIKLRANKGCLELENKKTYKATNIESDFIVKIGEIDVRIFHRFVGYSVIFKFNKDVRPEEMSYLEAYNSSRKVYKDFKTSILAKCISNENANTFYTTEIHSMKNDGSFHSHNNELRNTQLKFNTITEVNDHEIKK